MTTVSILPINLTGIVGTMEIGGHAIGVVIVAQRTCYKIMARLQCDSITRARDMPARGYTHVIAGM